METVLNTMTRWMVVFALMIAYWPFGHAAHATEMNATWKPTLVKFQKTLYTARFSWKGAAYLFTIGTVGRAKGDLDHSRFVAQISTAPAANWGEHIVATCQREVSGEAPLDVQSMRLRCEGELFGPASVQTKFWFAPQLAHPQLVVWTEAQGAPTSIALRGEPGSVHVASAQ